MTRLDTAIKAFISYYETKYPEYVLCAEDEDRICAMQAALDAADAWIKDAEAALDAHVWTGPVTISTLADAWKNNGNKVSVDDNGTVTAYDDTLPGTFHHATSRPSLSHSFSEHFAEEFRKYNHPKGVGDPGPHRMAHIIGVALEKAFEERERK